MYENIKYENYVGASKVVPVATPEVKAELKENVRNQLRELAKDNRLGQAIIEFTDEGDEVIGFEEMDIEAVELLQDWDFAGDAFDKIWIQYYLPFDILPA